MPQAPLMSTIIAIGLIPVALLFIHAFASGLKKGGLHPVTGTTAIVCDMGMSLGYMIARSLHPSIAVGPTAEGLVRKLFWVHGPISGIVILLEVAVLLTGIANYRLKKGALDPPALHGKLSRTLFYLWWVSFLSGEALYLMRYGL
jgi:hypothetical protein